jgi:hypothetical protein
MRDARSMRSASGCITPRRIVDRPAIARGAVRQPGDFGTGYSSLFYLAWLPVEALKIDRSLLASLVEDESTMTLARTMISLAQGDRRGCGAAALTAALPPAR